MRKGADSGNATTKADISPPRHRQAPPFVSLPVPVPPFGSDYCTSVHTCAHHMTYNTKWWVKGEATQRMLSSSEMHGESTMRIWQSCILSSPLPLLPAAEELATELFHSNRFVCLFCFFFWGQVALCNWLVWNLQGSPGCHAFASWVLKLKVCATMSSLLNRCYFLDLLREVTKEIKGTSLGMVAHTCYSSTQETQTAGSLQIQGQLGLYSEFQASLSYRVSPSLKKEKKKIKSGNLLMFLTQQKCGQHWRIA